MTRLAYRFKDRLANHFNRRNIKYGLALVTKKPAFNLLLNDRGDLRANQIRNYFGYRSFADAYSGKKPVAWVNLFFPNELLYAIDYAPFLPEVAAALASGFKISSLLLEKSESEWHSSDTCSFHRCAIGSALADYMPIPDVVIATTNLCDGAARSFFLCSRIYNEDFLTIDIPYYLNEESIKYVSSQLKELTTKLCEISGRKFDIDKLRDTVKLSNEARIYIKKSNELRMANPSPISRFDGLAYILALTASQGLHDGVHIYKTLTSELEQKIQENKTSGKPKDKLRLLWMHLKPYYNNKIMDMFLNEFGAEIAFEEFNYVYWDEIDVRDPFRGLAIKCLQNMGNGPVSRRIEVIKKLISDYQIDAVVHFSHWGCKQSNGAIRVIKEEISRAGTPFLSLDGDCVDSRNYSEGQYRTRIEGFFETI
ncbi:MAG: 2-hydroxyacyl-CoA dehydratase family protein [Actinobacteria bacterium]|nr:2-hydroxyacyl-CoA dehydratase family protein [Actinomycetota bacterium]